MLRPQTLLMFVMLTITTNALASKSVCLEYNDIISNQCIPVAKLKKDLTPEMLKGYSVTGCRHKAFKIALESDPFVSASCEPVMSGKLITALE
ncbi:MAG: hypothetical protein EOP06_17410 [Proteobacteria bacterium]|nr:MAG: hypothetical protein EOP06_17410 [Pseudomonadota bacterium]